MYELCRHSKNFKIIMYIKLRYFGIMIVSLDDKKIVSDFTTHTETMAISINVVLLKSHKLSFKHDINRSFFTSSINIKARFMYIECF